MRRVSASGSGGLSRKRRITMGMTLRSCELDVRTGGKYRLVFGDDPANPMAFFGKYLDVVPNQRIVWTNEEGGADGSVTLRHLTSERTLLTLPGGGLPARGVLITPLEKDFERLDGASVERIYREVSLDQETVDRVIAAMAR